jgi:hypothetical protein
MGKRKRNVEAVTKDVHDAQHTTSEVDYSKFTVIKLKDILRDRGLRTTGNKADLIQRIMESDAVRPKQDSITDQQGNVLNYVLSCQLMYIDPPEISREISVPPTITFHQLHRVLQVAFGWASVHMYKFDVSRGDQNEVATIQKDPDPELFEPDSNEDEPLWGYIKMFMPKKPTPYFSKETTLHEIVTKYSSMDIVYEYDFGDRWEHLVKVKGRGPAVDTPYGVKCLSGTGHACAEDVGGRGGWAQLKAAFKAAVKSVDQLELIDWFKNECQNRDPSGLDDPSAFDLEAINEELSEINLGEKTDLSLDY